MLFVFSQSRASVVRTVTAQVKKWYKARMQSIRNEGYTRFKSIQQTLFTLVLRFQANALVEIPSFSVYASTTTSCDLFGMEALFLVERSACLRTVSKECSVVTNMNILKLQRVPCRFMHCS